MACKLPGRCTRISRIGHTPQRSEGCRRAYLESRNPLSFPCREANENQRRLACNQLILITWRYRRQVTSQLTVHRARIIARGYARLDSTLSTPSSISSDYWFGSGRPIHTTYRQYITSPRRRNETFPTRNVQGEFSWRIKGVAS